MVAPKPRWLCTLAASNITRTASTMSCLISISFWRREDRRTGSWLRNDHRTRQRAGRTRAWSESDQLPGQRSISNPEHRKHVCEVWDLPEAELPQAGVSVVEMFQKMREGEIRGLLSICNNVMVSLPDTNEVRRSLEGLDFYVCIDFFMSEGSRYADVVLPGSAWSEDEGVTCKQRRTRRENQQSRQSAGRGSR